MYIPTMILRRLYTYSSLKNYSNGFLFSVKNRLSDAKLTGLYEIRLDGKKISPENITLELSDGIRLTTNQVSADRPIDFPLRQTVNIYIKGVELTIGKHKLDIRFRAEPFGDLHFDIEDSVTEEDNKFVRIPRGTVDDYAEDIIAERQRFVEQFTGSKLEHTLRYSFDPHVTKGNIENFSGVAQIPLGFAGPLHINGEHAQGDFLIPLATTEGTLVASYNRGMKLLNLCGGATTTIVGDFMQRAPVFVFENARQGRDFLLWIQSHMDIIREQAESSSKVAKLIEIDPYLSNKFVFLRFNYTTGDAAGQNMVGRATFVACSWIIDNYPGIQRFYLESNLATDKKTSQINIMRTRGKRVTAEAVIERELLVQIMRVEPESLAYHFGVATVGAILSSVNNNGAQSANGITAIFIATGQDVANVAESSAAIIYTELTNEKDLYISVTIPSLIVATYGGGTSLPTQRECLELLGCYGKGKVYKLAEIVAGTVLAGELSLASAISSSDWVSSHEQYGRNR